MNKEFIANKEIELMSFLRENISNKSKNNIKSFLHKKMIKVNGKVITNPKYNLNKNDKVNLSNNFIFDNKYNIKILYEDDNIIVLDKPENILTISTKKEKNITLYNIVKKYIKETNKNNKIFTIHRLDKGTSGVIMFAKNLEAKNIFQNNWNNIVINKEYFLVCPSNINNSGIIKSYLKENKEGKMFSTKNKNEGKLSITKYEKISFNKEYALVKVNIKTGRKNQIRAHFSEMNAPIVGDVKYNSKIKEKRLYLHSYKLEIFNPILKKKQAFISEIPVSFSKYVK